jgi:hypothetical protein
MNSEFIALVSNRESAFQSRLLGLSLGVWRGDQDSRGEMVQENPYFRSFSMGFSPRGHVLCICFIARR